MDSHSYQILHTTTLNKDYRNHGESTKLVEEMFKGAMALESDAEVLRFASDQASVIGPIIELGVYLGRTINFLAALNPKSRVFGFDSFKGLPEDWIRTDKNCPKGTFSVKEGWTPQVLGNVTLVKGLFKDSLPAFRKNFLKPGKQISILHIDCDIYFSTKQGLEILSPHLGDGTILVFDEFYNYGGYEHHEYKAFLEFIAFRNDLDYRVIAFNKYHEQVAFRLVQTA